MTTVRMLLVSSEVELHFFLFFFSCSLWVYWDDLRFASMKMELLHCLVWDREGGGCGNLLEVVTRCDFSHSL